MSCDSFEWTCERCGKAYRDPFFTSYPREFISGLPKASLEQNAFDTFERILACVDYERGNIFDYLADLIDPEEEDDD